MAELALARRGLPNDPQVLFLTGLVLRRQGRWEESTRDLERAFSLDPRKIDLVYQLGLSYDFMRHYADYEHLLQRALAVYPGDPALRLMLASIQMNMRADTRPVQSTMASMLAENPGLGLDLYEPDADLYERSPAARARALAHLSPQGSTAEGGVVLPHAYWEAVFARCAGEALVARAAFTAARTEVAKTVTAQPKAAAALSYLGTIDAGLGRKEEAISEGRRACELLPVAEDALDGSSIAINLAMIYAWTGENAAATKILTAMGSSPSELSYGSLKLDPTWDALRDDAAFKVLVASLAPKP